MDTDSDDENWGGKKRKPKKYRTKSHKQRLTKNKDL
jgi:hypothetical protein